ncbi:hypothetical protein CPB84DRAFT_1809164 [Gymnopilus junonius]|uniref:Uncharacterized protein n=1 Tax=Gymnopilus junonius TaxID=109634 RepID=A0A9P5TFK7_GYMJU|nr:hypothetical protein CPB84DRAFT_1809164 [Gymnopilus junonius]
MFFSKEDLSQVSWHAFSREAMFDKRWYLRGERLVVYTATMLISMAAQAAATYCMFKYRNLRTHIQNFSMHEAHVHNSDIMASTILSMIFPTFLSLMLNMEYFLLLFWPGKKLPSGYVAYKKWGLVAVSGGMLGTTILSTVVAATRSASISGVDSATAKQLTDLYFRPPFEYKSWPQNIAWLVLMWITLVLNHISVILKLVALPHDGKEVLGSSSSESISDELDSQDANVLPVIGEKKPPFDIIVEEKSLASAS